MQTINLWQIEDLFGMIVRDPTGLQWSNQVAGYLCRHPVLEGFFVPLPRRWFEVNSIENMVGFVKGDKDLRAQNQKVVQLLLEKNAELAKRFDFDGDYGEAASEAWVPLKVKPSEDEILKPFWGMAVVITYENSD